MSNKETGDQINALAAWFQFQEIHPTQAVIVMNTLMIKMKEIAQRPKPMRHFLFSIMLKNGSWMHSYVMCEDKFDEKVCVHEMLNIMEDKGIQPAMPITMATKLTDDKTINRVRDMVCAVSPDALAQMAAATDFHRTMWLTDDPKMNEEIAAIH